MKRTYDELGLCQAQFGKPRCPACTREARTNPFAPGAIEAFRRRRPGRRYALKAVLLSAAIGLLAGYARGKGWL
jgi:hypothetical protein